VKKVEQNENIDSRRRKGYVRCPCGGAETYERRIPDMVLIFHFMLQTRPRIHSDGAELYFHKKMTRIISARGLPLTPCSALCEVRDAIGFRVVCRFIDDIYKNISRIKDLPGITVVKEKGMPASKESLYCPYISI